MGTGLDHPIIRDTQFSHETEDLLYFLVFTVALPWPTARSAATIEPTIQEAVSKIRALKNRAP
jgi:hypothetical protein